MNTDTITHIAAKCRVVKIFRVSGRRQILRRGLSESDAQAVVRRYPDSTRSMVVYYRES